MKRQYQGWGVWCLVLAILFAQSGSSTYLVYAQEVQAELDAKIAQLEKLFDALEAASKDIPRDTFDLEAALELTDLTPEGILAWVRDNTYLVPYQGALRGAQGVLMDRVGNSLDRALLLQGLLQLLGYDTQLARAQLNEAQAQDVLAKTKPIAAEGTLPQTADADINTEIQRYISEFGLDGAQVTQALEQANQQRETLQAQMKERVASQTEFLMNALGSPTGDVATEKAKQVAATRDHWWVQYQEGGVWVDLDPTLPNAVPNQKIVAASGTLVANKVEDLPADLLHTLQIKVVLECALESGLTETTLVESPVLIPANLLGQRIALNHVPVNMPQTFDSSDSAALKDLILEQDRWFPMLTLGSEGLIDRDYTTSCEIGTATPPWIGTAVVDALGEATDLFDSLGGESAVATTREAISAQWIEYTIRAPGEAPQVIRRQIFDVLGPAARAAAQTYTPSEEQRLAWRLTLFGETEILPLFSQLSSDFVNHLNAERWLAQEQNIVVLLRDPTAATQELPPVPSQLYALAAARSQWNANPGHVYLGQLNVLTQHVQVTTTQQGRTTMLQAFDIVANTVSVNSTLSDPFTARLTQGVVDTNAESLLGVMACHDPGQTLVCYDITSAAETFTISKQQGTNWVAGENAAELDSKTTLWPVDALTRVKKDVSDGYAVIVPEQPVQTSDGPNVAWWRVDMQTGETLGIGENGWGPSAVEYALLGVAIFLACGTITSVANDGATLTNTQTVKCAVAGVAGGLGAFAALEAGVAAKVAGVIAIFLSGSVAGL